MGGLGLGALNVSAASTAAASKATKPLRLLILGGTGFIGPHMVQTALDRGHQVTIFNRGKSSTHLFPQVEKLKGDRAGQHSIRVNRQLRVCFRWTASGAKDVEIVDYH